MAAGKYPIKIDKGSDFTLGITLKNEDGTAFNLTGYSVRGKIKRKFSDTTEVKAFTCTVVSAANGTMTIYLSNVNTKVLPNMTMYYDIEIYTAADAVVKRILEGKVYVSEEVTT